MFGVSAFHWVTVRKKEACRSLLAARVLQVGLTWSPFPLVKTRSLSTSTNSHLPWTTSLLARMRCSSALSSLAHSCGGNFEDSGSFSCGFLSRCAVPMHLQCVAAFVSDQSLVCPHCHDESPTNINFGRFQHACRLNDVDTQQEIAALALGHRPWRRLSASYAVASECITTPRIAVVIIAPLHTGSSPVLTGLRIVVSLDHLHLPTDFNVLPSNTTVQFP